MPSSSVSAPGSAVPVGLCVVGGGSPDGGGGGSVGLPWPLPPPPLPLPGSVGFGAHGPTSGPPHVREPNQYAIRDPYGPFVPVPSRARLTHPATSSSQDD